MLTPLYFEKNIAALESKLAELQSLSSTGEMNIKEEITNLQQKVDKMLRQTYGRLTPWQKVLVARHSERPNFLEYIDFLIDDFVPLAGDRTFADDKAIIGGLGRFRDQSVVIMGTQKGRDTESRIKYNFGMARPEGYRKANRLMELAEHFQLPLLTIVDTAGAHPGVDAEERGQAEALATCIETGAKLTVPVVATISGEGGSGGAIALAVANTVNMLEHAVYSVSSPEACAAILWRTSDKKEAAAQALRLTSADLLQLGVIDNIIAEPLGGAHRNKNKTIVAVGDAIARALSKLLNMEPQALRHHRREKFLAMGKTGVV